MLTKVFFNSEVEDVCKFGWSSLWIYKSFYHYSKDIMPSKWEIAKLWSLNQWSMLITWDANLSQGVLNHHKCF